jgi:bacteriocin-like protein
MNMSNNTELSIDELDTVSGGQLNLGQFAWFHPTYKTSFGNNNGSPLYGNGSFHDTIDNNDNLP